MHELYIVWYQLVLEMTGRKVMLRDDKQELERKPNVAVVTAWCN